LVDLLFLYCVGPAVGVVALDVMGGWGLFYGLMPLIRVAFFFVWLF